MRKLSTESYRKRKTSYGGRRQSWKGESVPHTVEILSENGQLSAETKGGMISIPDPLKSEITQILQQDAQTRGLGSDGDPSIKIEFDIRSSGHYSPAYGLSGPVEQSVPGEGDDERSVEGAELVIKIQKNIPTEQQNPVNKRQAEDKRYPLSETGVAHASELFADEETLGNIDVDSSELGQIDADTQYEEMRDGREFENGPSDQSW